MTIAGDHRALGTVGTRFRIYAPPGVATRGAQAGTLPKFAEAASSRCLYKGYRYETAAAGRWTSQGIAARQGGNNFTGQHYTLFRHFDPSMMRFTSLDPIAASQNLWAYCDNNPHGSYDPDGLFVPAALDYLFNDGKLTKLYFENLKAGGAWAIDAAASFPGQDLGRGSDLSSQPGQYIIDEEAKTYGYEPYDSPFAKYAKRREYDAAQVRDDYIRAGGTPWVADVVGFTGKAAGYVVTTAATIYLTSGLPLQHAARFAPRVSGAVSRAWKWYASLERALPPRFSRLAGQRGSIRIMPRGQRGLPFDEMPHPKLSVRTSDADKTMGILRIGNTETTLTSGIAGPAESVPLGTPGFNAYFRTHVEGHSAAIVRAQNIQEATLYINNAPCRTCRTNLPFALPKNSKLTILGPGGYKQTFQGQ